MNGIHPFAVFPEEVWPLIAEKLQDSAEIVNLIKAIPELHDVLHYRKRWWLFDQVVPHLSRWLDDSEILNCRQVCKQWSHAVDNFRENHPIHRAYSHENQVTGQIWTYGGIPQPASYGRKDLSKRLRGQDSITRFLQNIENHPGARSPIVGRAVTLGYFFNNAFMNMISSELLPKMGGHLWHLIVFGGWPGEFSAFCNSVKEWLAQLPNLKSLAMRVIPDLEADPGIVNDMQLCLEPLPPLPHLEALEMDDISAVPLPLANALLTSYSHQIRRLDICFRYWRREYSGMFPNLTEFSVCMIRTVEQLVDIISSLEAPLLYSLSLYLVGGYPFQPEANQFVLATDVLLALKRFPLIRNLSLGFSVHPSDGGGQVSPDSIVASVKFLRISKDLPHANPNFLLCFPNLEYLDLEEGSWTLPQGPVNESTLNIWESIQNGRLYESNVWELFPKLKGLTLHTSEEERGWEMVDTYFKRETYEHQRRMAEAGEHQQ